MLALFFEAVFLKLVLVFFCSDMLLKLVLVLVLFLVRVLVLILLLVKKLFGGEFVCIIFYSWSCDSLAFLLSP